MSIMLRLPLLLLLLLLSQIQLHGSHALVRGHRHVTAGSSRNGRRTGRRFLPGNDEQGGSGGNNNMEGGDTAQPSRKPPPAPVSMPPVSSPTAPDTGVTAFPPTASPTTASSFESTTTTTNDLSAAPVLSPDSTSPILVNLLAFVVSVESTASEDEDVTASLEELLTKQLKKEFDSFISVDLVMQARQGGSGQRALSAELDYTGTASFDSEVDDQAVRDAQLLVLGDSAAVQSAAPSVTSIQIAENGVAANTPSTAPSTPTEQSNVLTIVVSVCASVAVVLALYFAYRYFSTPPPPPPKDASKKKSSSTPKEAYEADDGASQSMSGHYVSGGRSVEIDDYSLDGFSATGSEAGLDKTELFLLQRYKAKKLREQQQAAMANPNQPAASRYSNNNNCDVSCDGSDAGFSYDHVGWKGAESDDDLYTTESGAIEVGMDGSASFMTGYFGALGGGHRDGTTSSKTTTPAKKTTPKKTTPAATTPTPTTGWGKREVNEIPFDESSMDTPFDEMPTAKSKLPTPASKSKLPAPSSMRAEEQARIISNQVQYERDNADDDSAADYPVGRVRTNNSRKSADSDGEDLSSFLRDRRLAKRTARKNRETRKQPPISMEI